MDQALYAKACEDTWKHEDLYTEVVLRLGTFQTIFNLLSIIGKRFQDAGLRYICTESGIIAEGSVSDVLKGDTCAIMQIEVKCIYQALLQEGSWLLHLYAVHHMIPWFFAYDKFNYARYLVYYAQMADLPVDHPDARTLEFYGRPFFCAASRWESV